MTKLWLDLETFSEQDITEVGGYKYAEDETTEILLFAFAIDDDEPIVWDITTGEPPPIELIQALEDDTVECIAHNANFDRTILRMNRIGLPIPKLSRWRCTMAQALSHALPGKLSELCVVLKVPEDQTKLKEGKKLLDMFTQLQAKNRKLRRLTRETHPVEWERFKVYAAQDIVSMRECARRMPTWNWNASAIAEWHCDQRINDRGFQVDTELTAAGARAAITEKISINTEFTAITGGIRPGQREKFKAWVQENLHIYLDNTKRDTFEQYLKNPKLDPLTRRLMELSIAANKTSTAKYAALDIAVGRDGRFRGGVQFAGAGRTRRWAGRLFQPQNLPSRALPPAAMVAEYIECLKAGTHDIFFGELMRYGAAALRGCVIVAPGKKMVAADLSNIEGRKLSWFAGEGWKLKAFRDYDTIDPSGALDKKGQPKRLGPDLYNITATSIIGGDPWNVAKQDRNVFGKVPDLACLSEGQLVETDHGLVPIEKISVEMRLWDGIEFVSHDGVIERGVKNVIEYQGLIATPDHRVFVSESGRERVVCFGIAARTGATLLKSRPDRSQTTLREPQRSSVFELRCSGSAVQIPERVGSISLDRQEYRSTTSFDDAAGQDHERGTLRTGQSSLGDAAREQPQQTHQHNVFGLEPQRVALFKEPSGTAACNGLHPRADFCGCTSCSQRETQKLARDRGQARVFDILNAGPRNRFAISGVIVHNCGYRGGVTGFQTFAHAYGVRMEDHWITIQKMIDSEHVERAQWGLKNWGKGEPERLEISHTEWLASETCKLAWRARHPATVKLWSDVENACMRAIRQWGSVQTINNKLKVGCVTHHGLRWMCIRLPSGRYLTYLNPTLRSQRYGDRVSWTIWYEGQATEKDGKTSARFWSEISTHGGKMVGNICQTSARDVLAQALPEAEDAGYLTVLTVHDEAVTECDDKPEFNVEGLCAFLAKDREWTRGLPLSAAGFEDYRYKKED